jgi:hypothetical protein
MGLFSRKKRGNTDDPTLANIDESSASVDDEAPSADIEPGPAPLEAVEMLIDREWERIAGPGSWWTGGERVAIATDARRAAAGMEPSGVLPPPVEEATRRVALDAAGIRDTDVARWEFEGLDHFAYVEIVGIVSRLLALDVTMLGLGRTPRPLPDDLPGDSTGEKPDGAAITTGWAPTVGPATAPSSLSAVPGEAAGMWDVHAVLYLSLDQMFDMQVELDGLTRPQIELVAARTSALNECFY